jgi:hypothetical protein
MAPYPETIYLSPTLVYKIFMPRQSRLGAINGGLMEQMRFSFPDTMVLVNPDDCTHVKVGDIVHWEHVQGGRLMPKAYVVVRVPQTNRDGDFVVESMDERKYTFRASPSMFGLMWVNG